MRQDSLPTTDSLDAALRDARVAWTGHDDHSPDALSLARRESGVVARMRAARERSSASEANRAPRGWRVALRDCWLAFAQTRFFPAAAGSLATLTLLAVSAPWWLQLARESYEVATPFMLVSQPQSAQLDIAQMVRVNVSREAMLDFGIPVPPQQLGESVKAEMLMGARGDVLAVRFVEPAPGRRWRWQMH